MEEVENNRIVICHLVGFLINKVVKDESEWESWGKEFLFQMYTVQFGFIKVMFSTNFYLT